MNLLVFVWTAVICTAVIVRAINRVYRRLDRLPRRKVARLFNGTELHQDD